MDFIPVRNLTCDVLLRTFSLQHTSARLLLQSEEVSSIVTIKSLIYLIKPFRTISFCICVCFSKENNGFHYSLLLSLALNLFVRIIHFKESFITSYQHITYALFFHNFHDYSRMRILVFLRILTIRSSSLKKIFCCLSHTSFWFSKVK